MTYDMECADGFHTLPPPSCTCSLGTLEMTCTGCVPLPSVAPSVTPTAGPSSSPSCTPTVVPSGAPSVTPSASPSVDPSASPSTDPTTYPSYSPSTTPSAAPTTSDPSFRPSTTPTVQPSDLPTTLPTFFPSHTPTLIPTTSVPSLMPSVSPTTACLPPDAPPQSSTAILLNSSYLSLDGAVPVSDDLLNQLKVDIADLYQIEPEEVYTTVVYRVGITALLHYQEVEQGSQIVERLDFPRHVA